MMLSEACTSRAWSKLAEETSRGKVSLSNATVLLVSKAEQCAGIMHQEGQGRQDKEYKAAQRDLKKDNVMNTRCFCY